MKGVKRMTVEQKDLRFHDKVNAEERDLKEDCQCFASEKAVYFLALPGLMMSTTVDAGILGPKRSKSSARYGLLY